MTKHIMLENVSRRGLIRAGVALSGLAVAMRILPASAATTYPTGAGGMPNGTQNDPHLFVSIDAAGLVTIIATRSEMGQGAKTSVPMVLADELGADWARCRVVQAEGDEPKYGNQDTDGSRSMRHWIQPMRQCGAALRTMLEVAAAKRWGVPAAEVEAGVHEVVHKTSGKKLGFGELAQDAMAQAMPAVESLTLKDAAKFRYMGKGNVGGVDLRDITIGKAVYAHDVKLPGLHHAVVARPPVLGSTLVSVDSTDAMKVPGVVKVVEVPGAKAPVGFLPLGGVAVVATNSWAAIKGRGALKLSWSDSPHAKYDSVAYREEMSAAAAKPGKVVRDVGNVDSALASAAKTVTAEYYVPHHAHAPMETPSATAVVKDGACEVWACVQSPYGTRKDVAKFLDLPNEKVAVNVTLLGGGFGRKSKCDFAIEAAFLSKEMGGAPVKVLWTREDDIQNSFYHTVDLERIEAGLDASGKVVAWRQRTVAPTIFSTFMPDPKVQHPLELGMGVVDMPYDIANLRMENPEIEAHVRIGWFRSVSNIPRAFAMQSFIAELAAAAGKDHKDFLLELIGRPRKLAAAEMGLKVDLWNYGEPEETYAIDTGRLANVVKVAAAQSDWGKSMPKGEGLGLAVHRSFVSYVASVVHVKVAQNGAVTIPRIDTAIDCGFPVNPERIRSQIEGAAVMGTSLAMYGEVSFKAGKAEQSNFADYQMLRITEAPLDVRVHMIPHGYDTPASGGGEPGVPPIPPARGNAIAAATGKRIRALPLAKADLKWA